MVTFVSLFLWLVTGVHPVEVAVGEDVAAVEVLLDGTSVGEITRPPWRIDCDFGARLQPHELIAVGRNSSGVMVDRAIQVINLPRDKAEVEILVEDRPDGESEVVRVIAESVERFEPVRITVTLDGEKLASDESGTYPFPRFDAERAHLVSAEADFPGGVSARSDITLGGPYGGRAMTALTAVPVEIEGKKRPTASDFAGAFRARGHTLGVAAVERPGARVYVVRDHRAWPELSEIGYRIRRRSPAAIRRWFSPPEQIQPSHDRLYFLTPNPEVHRGLTLFPVTGPFYMGRFSLPSFVTLDVSDKADPRGQMLARAVAVAGVRAMTDSVPRVVLLVLSKDAANDDDYPLPDEVRAYLRVLHVPLVVWSLAEEETAWGETVAIHNVTSVKKASERLMRALFSQWIVWVEGRFLPNEITVADGVAGFRLAGSEPAQPPPV